MSQGKLLVVDDDVFILEAYNSFLGGAGYEVCAASDYEQAIALVDASLDLALVDISIGDKSGIDVLKFIRSHNPDCAVIMVSGHADKRNAIDSLREGATDYLEKPVAPDELLHVVQRWLSYHFLKRENSRLHDYKAMYEALQSSEMKYEKLSLTLLENLKQSIQAFVDTLEARDPYTAGHQKRVCHLAKAIALEMGLPEDDVQGIYLAAAIHDLGKIHIPSDILSKPGKLTDLEYQIIKMHPQKGYDILKKVEYPWPISDIILQHHERLDGSGYPN
ncbi:MAG: response regulator, partial [Gallionella sp.]|nr:response regulator [Gallionella sp.]